MSDPLTNVEIEDVLSSIRRLVSEDARPRQAARPPVAEAERLVLTPALRVSEEPEAGDTPPPVLLTERADLVADPAAEAGDDAPDRRQADAGGAPLVLPEPANAADAPQAAADEPALTTALLLEQIVEEGVAQAVEEAVADAADPADMAGDAPEHEAAVEDWAETRVAECRVDMDDGIPDAELVTPAGPEPEPEPQAASPEPEPETADPAADLPEADKAEALTVDTSPEPEPEHDAGPDTPHTAETDMPEPAPSDEAARPDTAQARSQDTLESKIAALAEMVGERGEQDVWEDTAAEDEAVDTAVFHRASKRANRTDWPLDAGEEGSLDHRLTDEPSAYLDEDALRDMVAEIVRQELQGALGERITRNVRKLVRREIHRVLLTQDFD